MTNHKEFERKLEILQRRTNEEEGWNFEKYYREMNKLWTEVMEEKK